MLYTQSEDTDNNNGVSLTDTYTKHCLSVHRATLLPRPASLFIHIVHSPCHRHTWHSSSASSDKGQLSDDVTTKQKHCMGKPVLSWSSGRSTGCLLLCARERQPGKPASAGAFWKSCHHQGCCKVTFITNNQVGSLDEVSAYRKNASSN